MLFAALSTLLSAMFFACTAAPQIESGSVALENKDIKAVMIFSSGDREKISHYYKSRKRTKALPPGLQKHLQKYDELPPGLEGKKLPQDLDRTLTRLPEGYVRLKVGGDVVLMNEKTRVVFDVIWDLD